MPAPSHSVPARLATPALMGSDVDWAPGVQLENRADGVRSPGLASPNDAIGGGEKGAGCASDEAATGVEHLLLPVPISARGSANSSPSSHKASRDPHRKRSRRRAVRK